MTDDDDGLLRAPTATSVGRCSWRPRARCTVRWRGCASSQSLWHKLTRWTFVFFFCLIFLQFQMAWKCQKCQYLQRVLKCMFCLDVLQPVPLMWPGWSQPSLPCCHSWFGTHRLLPRPYTRSGLNFRKSTNSNRRNNFKLNTLDAEV